jgi:hypothetical protein
LGLVGLLALVGLFVLVGLGLRVLGVKVGIVTLLEQLFDYLKNFVEFFFSV